MSIILLVLLYIGAVSGRYRYSPQWQVPLQPFCAFGEAKHTGTHTPYPSTLVAAV